MTDVAPTSPTADHDPVAAMLHVLDLSTTAARTTEDIFTGSSLAMPLGRVFGGQVLAQSIVAAERTIPDDRAVHSMHGYFLRPGDSAQGITFSVDRIHFFRSSTVTVPPTALIFSSADFDNLVAVTSNFRVRSPSPRILTGLATSPIRPTALRDSAVTESPSLNRASMDLRLTTW